MRTLVKGAGVAGLATAWQLYRHGFDVTITDRAEKVASGASGLAGGMLAWRLVQGRTPTVGPRGPGGEG